MGVDRKELEEMADWMRANGIVEIETEPGGGLAGHRIIRRLLVCDKPEPPPQPQEPGEFGLPEALQGAKDDEAQRLMDERDRQWSEDQIRYAHTTGYSLNDEAPGAGVTRQTDG